MIDVEKVGRTTVITLARPEKANALNENMLSDIRDAVIGAADSHALILTGQGRVFSAGADLEDAANGLAVSPVWEQVSGAIAGFPGLTIAALNGTAAGGALGMVLACDLRLGVPTAKIFYPVMKLGFLPQPSDPARLAGLIGPARAKMILMSGQKIGADQALAWGLFDDVVQPQDLMPRAHDLAKDVGDAKLTHVTGIKAMVPPQG